MQALVTNIGEEVARKGLTEAAFHAMLEAAIMYYFEGKSLPDIKKHLGSTKFLKETAIASAQGLFMSRAQDAMAVMDVLGCADIDLKKGKLTLKKDCLVAALSANLLSKALSANYAERLQKVFAKRKDKFVDALAKLGFACQYVEKIAATLNLNIKGAELCSLVDAQRKKKGYKRKYKGKNKQPELKVTLSGLTVNYTEYDKKGKIKKKTIVGKGKYEKENLLVITDLKKKGKYTKAKIIKAIECCQSK